MKKFNSSIYLPFFFFLLFAFFFLLSANAQTSAKSEEDVIKSARDLFADGEYAAALPMYSQLLSLYPKDPNYSYRFGACRVFSEKDKESPLTYLEFGANDPAVEPEAFFFLGKAYHLNYRFNEALAQYKKFEEKGDSKSKEQLLLQQHITMCENGKKLLKNVSDIVVLEKKNLSKTDFFRNYDLSEFGGKIIITPDEFKQPFDIKKKKESIMYLQPNADIVYFSSYGEDGTNRKDIYIAKKIPGGNWGKPQILQGHINTEMDEDYPFIHPDGKTLYFASNGHNSMGGYDIFRSIFDETTQQWGQPQNIDFAINTPGDDYLYITDMEEKNAYFSSNRESSENEITVYRVKVERIPVDVAVIKGTFVAETTKSAKITIEDLKDGKTTGVFNTNATSGEYVLTVPNGGKFKFLVETPDNPFTYSGLVDIPKQKTLNALKQEMQLVSANGEQQLIIKNIFDEEATEEVQVLLAEILKEKASLEVNADKIKEELPVEKTEPVAVIKDSSVPMDTTGASSAASTPAGSKSENISNDEIVKIAKEDAKNAQKEASELKKETEIAYSIATEKNRLSAEKAGQAESLTNSAISATDPSEKQQKTEQAKQLKKESKLYAEQAVAAFGLASEIEKVATEKQKEADISFNYSQELENAAQQTSPEATAEKLAQLNESLHQQRSETPKNAYPDLQKEIETKRKESDIQTKLAKQLQDDVTNLENDISTLKTAAKAEKKKKDRERLDEQASLLERDLPAMQSEAQTAKDNAVQTQQELLALEKKESIMSSVVSQIKSTDKSAVTGAELNETDKSKLESDISSSEERIAQLSAELGSETKTEEPLVSIVSGSNSDNTQEIPADYETYYKQKIDAAESFYSPEETAKKEDAKATTYENWAKALEKESTELKQKVEQTTDETEKAALNEKATALDNSASEKRKQAQQSQATAAQLNAEKSSPTAETAEQVPADYETYYKQKIDAAESFYSPEETAKKEDAKATAYQNWAKALAKESTELKQKAEQTTDETEKTALNEKATALENSASEKRQQAQQSQATAAQLNAEKSPSSAETTEQVPADYETYYKQKIDAAESFYSPEETVKKEDAKATTYENWAKALEKESTELKQKAEQTTDETEKAALNEKAASLEISTVEKRKLSQESQATAAQLRLSKTGTASATTPPTGNELTPTTTSNNEIASYSEKYITTEKDAMKIQNEKDRNITLAEINKDWAGEISKEITSLTASMDTIQDDTKKAERREAIRLLEEIKTEKESKANTYAEKAIEAPPISTETYTLPVVVNEAEVPADYSLYFEYKIKEQEDKKTAAAAGSGSSNKREGIVAEDSKAVYYESWANAIDKEIEKLKTEADTVANEEDKRVAESKIAKLETESKEKRDLSVQSREQAKQMRQSSPELAMTTSPVEMPGIDVASLPPAAQQLAAQMEAEKVKEMLLGAKKYRIASYKNLIKAMESSMENSKSLREITSLDNQQKDLQKRIEDLNAEIAEDQLSIEQGGVTKPVNEVVDEKLTASVLANQQADSLQKEAVYLEYQANEMGFFKRKKKEELKQKAKAMQRASELKKQEAELANQSASVLMSIKDETQNAYRNSSQLPSENASKKAGDAASEATYFTDQANAARQNALTARKKKEKKRLNAEADSLEHLAKMKKIEAEHYSISAEELKKLEREVFIDMIAQAIKKDERLPLSEVELSDEEAAEIKENTEQINFSAQKKESKKLYDEAGVHNEESEKIKKESDVKLSQFTTLTSGIDTIATPETRTQIVKDAMDFLEQTKKDIIKGDSIGLIGLLKEELARKKLRETLIPMLDGDPTTMKKIFAYQYYTPPVDSSKLLAQVDTTPSDTASSDPIFQEPFTIGGSVQEYDDKNPIPLNPKYPDGLIWQVQIGAFRNPISQNLFKGFAPIMGVKINDGITRYSAGIFNTFALANDAKNAIVKLGYKDAFVVVYKNGVRITIPDARALIAKGLIEEGITVATDISSTPETTVGSINPSSSGSVNLSSNAVSNENSVAAIQGLFYTVQIGVYSKLVSDAQLKNVKPVNTEKLDNGTIRYSSGVYNNFNDASGAKSKIAEVGITDAFVTAYYNGKRISIAEAGKLSGSGSSSGSSNINKADVSYRVQLGKYNGDIPTKIAGVILELLRNKGKVQNENDANIYYSRDFKKFKEAEIFKNNANKKGLTDAVVVAFNNETIMDLEEAKRITE